MVADDRPEHAALAEADRRPRADDGAAANGQHTGDAYLAVRKVQAFADQNAILDVNIEEQGGEAVEQFREDRHMRIREPRLDAIQHHAGVGIGRPQQMQRIEPTADAAVELEALPAIRPEVARVGQQR